MLLSLLSLAFALGALAAGGAGARARAAPADSLPAYPPPRVRAWQVGPARADRLRHASLSFALAAGGTIASRRPATAFATVLAIGLAKECWDARTSGFDAGDLAAGAAGAALGAAAAGRSR